MVASAVEGKVAEVLNDREVVINRGEDHGVKLGTRFKLMETLRIKDPDTRDIIGEITREKLRLKVVHLEQSMSIARTYESYKYGGGLADLALQSLQELQGMQRIDVKRIRTSGDGDDTVLVEIGDIAIELTDDAS